MKPYTVQFDWQHSADATVVWFLKQLGIHKGLSCVTLKTLSRQTLKTKQSFPIIKQTRMLTSCEEQFNMEVCDRKYIWK